MSLIVACRSSLSVISNMKLGGGTSLLPPPLLQWSRIPLASGAYQFPLLEKKTYRQQRLKYKIIFFN